MRRPVYPCSFVSHSHAPCPINGFYQQSGAPAALRRAPRFVFLRSPLSFTLRLSRTLSVYDRDCPALASCTQVPAHSYLFKGNRRFAPCNPDYAPKMRPRLRACLCHLLHLSARGRLSCAVPHLSRTAGVCPARACLLSVERSFLRAIPQIFFTSFTAPLPSPPRGIFFRRVSAPRVPVLLVTFYPLVRL